MPLAGVLGLLGLLGSAAAKPPPGPVPGILLTPSGGSGGGGAACLDGSPGALCLRTGSSSGQWLWQQPESFPCASRCKADDEQLMFSGPVWRDPSLSVEKRLDDLMPRLTPADLVAQLGGTLIRALSSRIC